MTKSTKTSTTAIAVAISSALALSACAGTGPHSDGHSRAGYGDGLASNVATIPDRALF
ncbi:hypothetical protein [Gluconacetobacter diazotrophicus]|uniref:hypothetical protein n=1 Tax=Gluconacetobacter diazotrophicus TaxID=33996 RepID=UPI0011997F16|nr:hypothetical protein [Gluconacetobacter diazotrophicus]TWB08522.1 hypothetical protein FBZ86_10617 [Gluconacetobacter diazotrophicus]